MRCWLAIFSIAKVISGNRFTSNNEGPRRKASASGALAWALRENASMVPMVLFGAAGL